MQIQIDVKKQNKILLSFVGVFIFILNIAYSQSFKNEIDAFQKADNISMPAQGGIVFAGSSSFRMWKNINTTFPDYPIINRGFGGSSLPDVIYYAQETILKYKPKQIFIYCGENDIAGNSTVTADTVLQRFKKLFSLIRTNLNKKTEVVYVSIKPSVSRWHLEKTFVEANSLIKKFLSRESNTKFLDVHSSMLNDDGTVMKDIFIEDNLHMNAKGYKIWESIIQPALMK
jgi:lysophospholipase L1-like esterase